MPRCLAWNKPDFTHRVEPALRTNFHMIYGKRQQLRKRSRFMLNGTALISVHLQFCFQRPDVPVWIFQLKEDLCTPVGWPAMIRSYLLICYSCSCGCYRNENKLGKLSVAEIVPQIIPSILGFKLVNWQSLCDWSSTRLILWEKQTKFQARARPYIRADMISLLASAS